MPTIMDDTNPAQSEFDKKYITAWEVMRTVGVTRAALLYARRTHKLPDPITLNDGTLFIWLREDVQPYLDAWKIVLDTRRGH